MKASVSEPLERRFRVWAAGTHRIESIEILRNNQVVFTARPGCDVWEGEWVDAQPLPGLALGPSFQGDRPFLFYYLRLTQGNRQRAWAGPIWLTQKA